MAREFFLIIICSVILFVSAGTVKWLSAWIYISLVFLIQIARTIFILIYNPGLINERGKLIAPGTKKYEIAFVLIYFVSLILISAISGFAVRFNWSMLPFCYLVPGVILLIFSSVLGIWAMASNPFFAVTQRTQNDRNHSVIKSGPYEDVRHPGYLSWILSAVSYPLVLGPAVGFIPVSVMIIVFIIRTYLEDSALLKGLTGYDDYSGKTKYKQVPFVW